MSPRDASSPSTELFEPTATHAATPRPTKVPTPTGRTALRDLERTQFDALEAQLRDLDR